MIRPEPVGLARDPLGQLADDHLVAAGRHRLGEQRQRADRRLQLVADVGDEVPSHALAAARLRDVPDVHDRTEDRTVGEQRLGAEEQHLTRRTEELELAFAGLALPRPAEQLVDLLLGQRVGVPTVAEPLGRVVAEQLGAVGVHDDDGVRRRVECFRELEQLRAHPHRCASAGVPPPGALPAIRVRKLIRTDR